MRRRVLNVVTILCAALALAEFVAPGGARANDAAPGSPAIVSAGHALFLGSCASCHGLDAKGIVGRAPSLRGVGALAANFYLETGRMPLPSPRAQPMRTRPAFSQSEIAALDAYVGSFGGPAVPIVDAASGSLPAGEQLFAINCAGCHTIQGQGGIVTGAVVPPLGKATAVEIAEAIRIGPYAMPRFGAGEISNAQIASIARYVRSTQRPENLGGWGIGQVGPISEGMVAWLLAAVALLLVARLLGERMPAGPRRPPSQPSEEE